MYFSLPVNINNRRIHICKLISETEQAQANTQTPVVQSSSIKENEIKDLELTYKFEVGERTAEKAILDNLRAKKRTLTQTKRTAKVENKLAREALSKAEKAYNKIKKDPEASIPALEELNNAKEELDKSIAKLEELNQEISETTAKVQESKTKYEGVRDEANRQRAALRTLKSKKELLKSRQQQRRTATTSFYRFIVPQVADSTLFSFLLPSSKKTLKCSNGFHQDKNISEGQHFEWNRKTGTLAIHLHYANSLAIKEKPQALKTSLQEDGIVVKKEQWNGQEVLSAKLVDNNNNNNLKQPQIVVKISYYTEQEAAYTYSFTISLVALEKKFDLALDFGSEASQAAFKQGNQEDTIFVDLLEELKDKYGYSALAKEQFYPAPNKEEAGNEPLQKESHPLFTSNFFLRKGTKPILSLASGIDNPVQLLLPKDQVLRQLIHLPNSKLFELVSPSFFSGKKGQQALAEESGRAQLKLSIISQLLQACLYKIMRSCNKSPRSIGIIFTLLVPNRYHQLQVYTLIKECYAFIATLKELPIFAPILDIEVQTISESDAAFKGFIANKLAVADPRFFIGEPEQKKQHFLLIDGGKSSINLSILERDKNSKQKYQCIYRAGIVGAGQFFSFITMEIILKELQVELTTITKLLKAADLPSRLSFWQAIEALKKANRFDLGKNQGKSPLNYQNLNDITAAIQTFHKDNKFLPDVKLKQGLNQICNRLNELIGSALEEKIVFHKVILAGRAFHFSPFRNAVKVALLHDDFISEKEAVLFDSPLAKRMCIEGTLSPACQVNHNTDLVGGLLIKEQAPKRSLFSYLIDGRSKSKIKITNLRLDTDFLHGTSEENIFQPKVAEASFFIGNKHYQAARTHHQNSRLSDHKQLQINVEQDAFVLRFPDQKNIKLVYNKPINQEEEYLIKSIFPEGGLDEITTFTTNRNSAIKQYILETTKPFGTEINLFDQKTQGESEINFFT